MNNTKSTIRSVNIDLLRFIAIVFVVVGHSIQYGSGSNYSYYDNLLFRIIYSFHMPLFTIISGYLFYNSINKYKTKTLIGKRLLSLGIPIITYSTLGVILEIIEGNVSIHNISLLKDTILLYFTNSVWFLRAILLLSIIVIVVNRLFKDNIFVYIFLSILTVFSPVEFILYLYGYLLPYFIIGYLVNKYELLEKLKYKEYIFVFSFIFYLVLLLAFNNNCYIYTTGMSIINNPKQIIIDLYRFTIGLLGCISIIGFIRMLKIKSINNKYVISISKNTLGIYTISCILFRYLGLITNSLKSINYLYLLIEVIVIISLTMLIIDLLKKNKILSRLFLGC